MGPLEGYLPIVELDVVPGTMLPPPGVAALGPLPIPWGLLLRLGILVPFLKIYWEDPLCWVILW